MYGNRTGIILLMLYFIRRSNGKIIAIIQITFTDGEEKSVRLLCCFAYETTWLIWISKYIFLWQIVHVHVQIEIFVLFLFFYFLFCKPSRDDSSWNCMSSLPFAIALSAYSFHSNNVAYSHFHIHISQQNVTEFIHIRFFFII